MKDILGREVTVGDRVVFKTPYGHSLKIGRVEDIVDEKGVPFAKIRDYLVEKKFLVLA